MQDRAFIAVVDDDESVRESLPDLVREFGYEAGAFSSAEEFLASGCLPQTRCLLLDIAMPGMSGIDLQRELARLGQAVPIVFITAHGDEGIRGRLRDGGAVECLMKPFTDTALLEALDAAVHSGVQSKVQSGEQSGEQSGGTASALRPGTGRD